MAARSMSSNAGSQEEGLPLAEPYCERSGRVAVFQEVTQYRFYQGRNKAARFECRTAKPFEAVRLVTERPVRFVAVPFVTTRSSSVARSWFAWAVPMGS